MNRVCYKHLLKAFSILREKKNMAKPLLSNFPHLVHYSRSIFGWRINGFFCSIPGNIAVKLAAKARGMGQPEVLLFFWKWFNFCIVTEHPFIHSFSHLSPPPPTETLNSSILSFTSCLTVLPVVLTQFTLWLICSLLHQWIGRSAD